MVFTAKRKRRGRAQYASVAYRRDSDGIFAVARYIRKRYDVRQSQIRQECTVEFTPNGCVIHGENMSYMDISVLSKTRIIHTPDIVVTDTEGKPGLIVELDGRIHESEKVTARDRRRNGNYARSGVPFVVISKARLEREGRHAFEHLDEEIKRIGWPRERMPGRGQDPARVPAPGEAAPGAAGRAPGNTDSD